VFLAIDTSLATAVAVVEADGYVVAEADSADPLAHAEVIGELLRQVDHDRLTHVVAGMGPGPFTGLRVGIAAARAFALGRDLPVVPVPSHDAVALALLLDAALTGGDVPDDDAPRFAVVTDARRREYAYTVYSGLDEDGLPRRVTEPALVPRDDLDARLAELGAVRRDAASVPAAMLAVVGARAVAVGRTVGPVEPLYLRSPDVTAAHAPKKVRA
jgi:tRNA threonylcarbamoyladenosine biosynthesis protein TsaB